MMLSPGWGWVAGSSWHVCGNHHHHVPTLHRIDPPLPQCGVCTPSSQQVRCGEYVGSEAGDSTVQYSTVQCSGLVLSS